MNIRLGLSVIGFLLATTSVGFSGEKLDCIDHPPESLMDLRRCAAFKLGLSRVVGSDNPAGWEGQFNQRYQDAESDFSLRSSLKPGNVPTGSLILQYAGLYSVGLPFFYLLDITEDAKSWGVGLSPRFGSDWANVRIYVGFGGLSDRHHLLEKENFSKGAWMFGPEISIEPSPGRNFVRLFFLVSSQSDSAENQFEETIDDEGNLKTHLVEPGYAVSRHKSLISLKGQQFVSQKIGVMYSITRDQASASFRRSFPTEKWKKLRVSDTKLKVGILYAF